MAKVITILFLVFSASLQAQNRDTAALQFSGYLETFWSFDANRPEGNRAPFFLYSHNRHNEFNINLAFLQAAYSGRQVRARFALAAGTYMADNYAAEPQALRNILEANAGVKLGERVWLDAGILPSHIGFESAVSKDCPTPTRSLAAENSPYYEAGARLVFTPDEHWTLAALVLNGWQRIARTNTSPAFGSQIAWKPTPATTLNWSTYVGNERPDSARLWRVFQNFYGIFQLTEKIALTAGFDIGTQESPVEGQDLWFSPVAIARMQCSEKWAVALRLENYTDRDAAIIAPDFSVTGASVNVDFAPSENALLRFETRYLGSDNAVFQGREGLKKSRLYGTVSLAVAF